MKHHVVALDKYVDVPAFDFEHDVTIIAGDSAQSQPDQLHDATIILGAAAKITKDMMQHAPNLQLINSNGTGTDHVDKQAVRELGLTLTHVPAQNTESVSEHAFALYFALRRQILPLHQFTIEGKLWQETRSQHKVFPRPPRTNAEETVVIGYGAIGKHVEKVAKALGMRVLVAERKGVSAIREGRVPFDVALKQGTVLISSLPLDESTRDLISSAELARMDASALLVNVGRGGIVNETALAKALKDGTIGGAATDVFEHEPATKSNSPLLDSSIPNLILSPHIAWFSHRTLEGTMLTIKVNVDGFVAGRPQNVVIAGSKPSTTT